MTYSEKICEKEFSDEISKKAYLDLCRWLAVNVYNKDELSEHCLVNITKKKVAKGQLPTFVLTLHYSWDEQEAAHDYCQKCKQLNTLLYSVEKPNCQTCKLEGYRKQTKANFQNVISFYKEVFKDK